jgi:hypothetical protein
MKRTDAWRPRAAPPGFTIDDIGSALHAKLTTGWQRLCEDERDSVIAATFVAADLARLGAPAEILGRASRVIEDEIRHVAVCTDVLSALGAAATEVPVKRRRKPHVDDDAIEVRTARTLLAGFAVGEPMSAACFAAARARARTPIFRWALTELLRDEVRHGDFGVAAGEWVVRDWSHSKRAALWPICVAEMEAFERRLGGPLNDPADMATSAPDASAVGLLSIGESCEAAVSCIPRWVLPALQRLGVAPPHDGAP